MRASWDETWMAVAHAVAQRSRCVRAQAGCVVVDANNRIVATGYNGPPATMWSAQSGTCDNFCERAMHGARPETLTSYDDCPSIHAEANALLFCDRREREGGTIYVTTNTCFTCAKLVANSGLTRVVHIVDAEYRGPRKAHTFLERCGLEVVSWAG